MAISSEKIERGIQQLKTLHMVLDYFDPADLEDNELINLYFVKIIDGLKRKCARQ